MHESVTHVRVVAADGENIWFEDKRCPRVIEDARLIAAAPELLEALEPFAHATLTHTGQVIGLTREDFERALAAIAKATGEPA
ncbi:hypothetical protein ABB33_05015 [Stenotrophomonas acidaminiphila]|nr:hypothetical protein ABB33_05015 [Stenotrophomonas acidaminiphila]